MLLWKMEAELNRIVDEMKGVDPKSEEYGELERRFIELKKEHQTLKEFERKVEQQEEEKAKTFWDRVKENPVPVLGLIMEGGLVVGLMLYESRNILTSKNAFSWIKRHRY